MSETLNAKIGNSASKAIDHAAEQAAGQASRAIAATQRAADQTLQGLQNGVDTLREDVPAAVNRAGAKVDALAHQGLERAREMASEVRQRAQDTGDRTVRYIRDEPVKSVLIAAAAGATLTAVLGLLAKRRNTRA